MYYPIGRIQRSKTVYIKRDAEGGIPYTIIDIEVLPNRADSIRPYKNNVIVNFYIVWYNIGNYIVR